MWSPVFNTAHGVTSYGVAASGGSITVCPSSCSPSEPCQCTGLVVGEDISINISATNCEFSQEGSSTAILARPRGDHRLTSKGRIKYTLLLSQFHHSLWNVLVCQCITRQ